MGRYNVEIVLRSEVTKEIIQYLSEHDQTYATTIANVYDRDRSVVSEVISNLEQMNVLQRSERGRAQYYSKSENFRELQRLISEHQELEDQMESVYRKARELKKEGDV